MRLEHTAPGVHYNSRHAEGAVGRARRREDRDREGHSGDAARRSGRRSRRSPRAIRAKARAAAARLGIAEGLRLLRGAARRSRVDAIYNPLPNHLHVPWTHPRRRARQARALREADRADRGRGADAARGARPDRRPHPGSVHGPHASAVAEGARRWCDGGAHRRAAGDGRRLQLLQRRSGEHPQHAGIRRRRADGHRLLSRSTPSRFIFEREPARVVGARSSATPTWASIA